MRLSFILLLAFLIIGAANIIFLDDERIDGLIISSVSACDSDAVCTSTDIAFPKSKLVENREMTIQEIVYTHPGDNDSCPLKIDNLRVSSWASSYPVDAPVAYAAYLDDGDGIFNINTDEKIDDEDVYDFSETVILGDDDNSECLEVLPGTSERVFIRFRPLTDVGASETVRIQVNATDVVNFYDIVEGSYVSSEFSTGEGNEIAFNMFYTENRSDVDSVSINDTNDNGIIDEMIIKTRFPIPDSEYDTLDYVSFQPNEEEFDDELRVTYKDEHVNIDSIDYFVNFTGSLGGSYANLKIVLDEEDPTIQTDTSVEDFEVSYLSDGDEDTYPIRICSEGITQGSAYSLPLEYFTLVPIDQAQPIIIDSTVSDTIMTSEDAGSTFVVTYQFSEAMDQTVLPAYDFNPEINNPDILLTVTDQEWIDDSTYQISFSVEEGEVYYENVDVQCLTENCFDLERNQMNAVYSASDVFMVDMKPPTFSNLPEDSVSAGQDYTVRLTVSDESDIGSVILNYQVDGNWNTKSMEYDLVNNQYYAMVSIPESTVDFHYKISAYDIYENSAETAVQDLSVEEDESGEGDDGGDDETDDDDIDDDAEKQDSDNDGYDDDMEETYGTNTTDESEMPEDTDDDGIPDDDSDDGNYTGDTDDDDDGLSDDMEESLGSDSKNNSDVTGIEELEGYLVDTDGDGSSDRFYVPSDETSTTVTKDDDGNYDIDVDGDGTSDYNYNVITKSIEEYGGTDTTDSTPGFSFGLIIVSLTLIILMLFHKKRF